MSRKRKLRVKRDFARKDELRGEKPNRQRQSPTAVGTFVAANTSDVRLIERAVRQGWKIPDAVFSSLPEAMIEIATLPSNSTRARIAATKAVIAMHGQNIDQEDRDKPTETPAVNVNVAVGVQVEAVKDRSDDELQRFLDETASARGVDEPALGGHPLSNGALSAFANGATVRISENGKH